MELVSIEGNEIIELHVFFKIKNFQHCLCIIALIPSSDDIFILY